MVARLARSLVVIVLFSCLLAGCNASHPTQVSKQESQSSATDPDGAMFDLVSREATFYILKHVDRPFEAKLVKPLVHIPPEDRTIATVVAYCEESKSTGVARRLFLVIIENNASPARPKDKSDLSCLLVNADGKVLEKDSDYWDSLPRDAQEGSGAVDTKGPPFLAQTILKLSPNH